MSWVLVAPERSAFGKSDGYDLGGIRDGDRWVCRFGDNTRYSEEAGEPPSDADAALMIAAPELLGALEQIADRAAYADDEDVAPDVRSIALAAILKARGKA